MNRGSGVIRLADPAPGPSFNEAPIHESGKWAGLRGSAGGPIRRFNEAPIHESGKSEVDWLSEADEATLQ